MRVCIREACFACISSADVASVHGSGDVGSLCSLTQPSRTGYCDVCVLKMREIFRFQPKAVDRPLTQVTTPTTTTNNYFVCCEILCFFYLVFSIRLLVCMCTNLLLCLLEMATGFSVFRGSYKITYLWNQAEPAAGSRVLRLRVNNLIQVTRPLSRTAPFVV